MNTTHLPQRLRQIQLSFFQRFHLEIARDLVDSKFGLDMDDDIHSSIMNLQMKQRAQELHEARIQSKSNSLRARGKVRDPLTKESEIEHSNKIVQFFSDDRPLGLSCRIVKQFGAGATVSLTQLTPIIGLAFSKKIAKELCDHGCLKKINRAGTRDDPLYTVTGHIHYISLSERLRRKLNFELARSIYNNSPDSTYWNAVTFSVNSHGEGLSIKELVTGMELEETTGLSKHHNGNYNINYGRLMLFAPLNEDISILPPSEISLRAKTLVADSLLRYDNPDVEFDVSCASLDAKSAKSACDNASTNLEFFSDYLKVTAVSHSEKLNGVDRYAAIQVIAPIKIN